MGFIRYTVLFILVLYFSPLSGQAIDSAFMKIREELGLKDTLETIPDLYLHTDKIIYHTQEDVWFTAYLLNGRDLNQYNTLFLLLVNEMNNTIVSSGRFVISNGIGSGSLFIPDSLYSGAYSIIGYTNNFIQKPNEKFYRQSVRIISARKSPFRIKFYSTDSLNASTIKCKINSLIDSDVSAINMSYKLYVDGELWHYDKIQTNSVGEVYFTVPVDYKLKSLELVGELKKAKNIMPFKIPVKYESSEINIKYYPEGGSLVNQIDSRVTFDISDASGTAISTRGSLMEDEKRLMSIKSDNYGLGSFEFTPRTGKKYSLVLDGVEQNKVIQKFPDILPVGYNLHIGNSIIKDSLLVNMTGPTINSKCLIVIHNDQEVFFSAYLNLPNGNGKLQISSKEWPRGISTVSMFDQNGILKQQRSLYVANSDSIKVSISLDSTSYTTRSKVTLQIRLKDVNGRPIKGTFSFSCAMTNMSSNQNSDIVRFQEFDRFLADPVLLPASSYLGEPQHLDNVLNRQGAVSNGSAWQFKGKFPKSLFDGHLEFSGKKLRRPAQLLIAGGVTGIFSTDSSGNFNIPYEFLRGSPKTKVLLSVNKFSEGYSILLDTPGKEITKEIIGRYYRLNLAAKTEFSIEEKEQLGLLTENPLSEVVVKSKIAESKDYYGKIGDNGRCDDYVCIRNFLNCTYHGRYREPMDGERVFIEALGGTKTMIYHCTYSGMPPYIKSINATWYPDHFPELDVLKFSPLELYNQSTLSWVPSFSTKDDGTATITFYTNDLKGDFSCSVQGVNSSGMVFSGSAIFSVKSKQ